MIKENTLNQIFEVVSNTVGHVQEGYSSKEAYVKSVKFVANKYGLKYQTIGDGCRRRMRLSSIEEFRELIDIYHIKGRAERLQSILMANSPEYLHYKIKYFFISKKIKPIHF